MSTCLVSIQKLFSKVHIFVVLFSSNQKFEGHSVSVSSWFPSYNVMPDELKLKLILKAIILLKVRKIYSKISW